MPQVLLQSVIRTDASEKSYGLFFFVFKIYFSLNLLEQFLQ